MSEKKKAPAATGATQSRPLNNEVPPAFLQALDADAESAGCGSVLTVYYDCARKEYLMKNKSTGWTPYTEGQFKRHLRAAGFSTRAADGAFISPADKEIIFVQEERGVHYAGLLAGYREGFRKVDGFRFLVTESPQLIEPDPGNWETLRKTFEAVLQDPEHDQLTFFYGWLRCAIQSLRAESFQPGQALAIAGAAESGKSLLQNLITRLLGGRSAKPYQYMTGGTGFNADLFKAEHLMIEDEAPSADYRSRRNLGTFIKQFTVNQDQRLHAKNRDALMLRPFWRVSITLNDEPEDLHVLPPIDAGLEDKLILLRAHRRTLPMPTQSPKERELFSKTLNAEMPAFLDWLLNEYSIPEQLKSQRFGIQHFHHPILLESLQELSNEAQLLELIDQHLTLPFCGTAAEMESCLRRSCGQQITKLLGFRGAAGTYLQRLSVQHPERIQRKRMGTHRGWEISPESNVDPVHPVTEWD